MERIKFIPIAEKTLNDKLVNLYGSHLVDLYTAIEPIFKNDESVKPALPLLLELEEDENGRYPYEDADLKVMVFGRENNNWNDTDERKDCPYGTYNFNLQTSDDIIHEISGKHVEGEDEIYGIGDIYHAYCYEETGLWKTPFTRRMNQFVDQLSNQMGAKKVEAIWNNVHKIGRGGELHGKSCGQPTAQIRDIERTYFNVIVEEVNILKPDVVIFMTGVEADDVIREKFGLSVDDFTAIRDGLFLHRINIPGVKYVARTIHPGHKSNEKWNEYSNALIEDILKHI